MEEIKNSEGKSDRILDETFAMRVTNQKTEPVRVPIQELCIAGITGRLRRWMMGFGTLGEFGRRWVWRMRWFGRGGMICRWSR